MDTAGNDHGPARGSDGSGSDGKKHAIAHCLQYRCMCVLSAGKDCTVQTASIHGSSVFFNVEAALGHMRLIRNCFADMDGTGLHAACSSLLISVGAWLADVSAVCRSRLLLELPSRTKAQMSEDADDMRANDNYPVHICFDTAHTLSFCGRRTPETSPHSRFVTTF